MKTVFVSVKSKIIHTSIAIRYLREYSMKNGLRTDIREYTINNDIEKAVIDLYNADSEIYGFSTYIFNLRHTLDIIKDLKKLRPDSIIFCGGPEVSYGYEQMLRENPCIDFIIRGEGEESVFRFLKTACECESACELKSYLAQNPECGVSFLYQNTLIDSPERAPIPDLDIIPFAYNENELSALKDRILYYESSRGCPFGCTYCMSSICHGVRVFSLKRVFEDLKRLIDSSVKQVKFVDRTFNFDKNRALKIWRFLKNNDNKHTNFHFEISIWLIDDETIDFLKTVRKGLFQFEIGIQSANDKTLEAINRKVGFDRISGAFTKMRNAGIIRKNICDRKGGLIKIHGDIISALPYEDINEFKNTFNRSFGLFPDELQLGFLKILKGTEISVQPEHGYVVSSRPPYEVLRNNYISYDDIVQLKYVEQCVEFYYSSCLCWFNPVFAYPLLFFLSYVFCGLCGSRDIAASCLRGWRFYL